MAKLVITYEHETIKKELTFRGVTYTNTMQPWSGCTRTSLEKRFDAQYMEKIAQDESFHEIMDVLDRIEYGDDEEIEEALGQLSEFE